MQDKQELKNSVADKVRRFFQNGEEVSFEDDEMEVFKEFGPTYLAYKHAISMPHNKQKGGIDNERE